MPDRVNTQGVPTPEDRYIRLHIPTNGGDLMTLVVTKGDGLPQLPPSAYDDKVHDKAVHAARNAVQAGTTDEHALALLTVVDDLRARLRFVTGENRDVHRVVLNLQEEVSRLRAHETPIVIPVDPAKPVPVEPVLNEATKQALAMANSNGKEPAWMWPVLMALALIAMVVLAVVSNGEEPTVTVPPPPDISQGEATEPPPNPQG